jgi:D-alanyl-D-alanine carboxypeptidase
MRHTAVLLFAVALAVPFSTMACADVKTLSVPKNIPPAIVERINANGKVFAREITSVLALDTEGLLVLADKQHTLSSTYVPSDLVDLNSNRSYVIGKNGLSLRLSAENALEEMARAARADGITLVASSSYRSWEYQKSVYERNVKELGQAAADRESARPGTSQHQLGTAVDFGTITDEFADTKAGKWLAVNAGRFGWSLSFPDGYESVTGYRWESWHYRYIGKEAVALQDTWFGGVQQYMLEYINEWKKS